MPTTDAIVKLLLRTVPGWYLFMIGMLVQRDEAAAVMTPSSGAVFQGFVVTVLNVALVWPAIVFSCLYVFRDALPLPAKAAMMALASTPGGPLSNMLAHGIGGSVSFNAIASLTMVLSSTIILPVASQTIAPLILELPAEEIISPLDELLFNLVLTFIPLPLGMLMRSRAQACVACLEQHLAPVTGVLYLLVIGSVVVKFLPSLELSTVLALIGAAWAPALLAFVSVCGLRIESTALQRSMVIETMIHDIPLAAALAVVCFGRLPTIILLQIAAMLQVYGFSTVAPFAIWTLIRSAGRKSARPLLM